MHSVGSVHNLPWVHADSTKFHLSFLQQDSYSVLFYFVHKGFWKSMLGKAWCILKTNLNMVSCLHLTSHHRTQGIGKHRVLQGLVVKVVNHKLITC